MWETKMKTEYKYDKSLQSTDFSNPGQFVQLKSWQVIVQLVRVRVFHAGNRTHNCVHGDILYS